MSNKSKVILFAIVAIIAGPVLGYLGYQEKNKIAALEKEGATVDGIISGGESERKRKGGTSYSFTVDYKTTDGKALTADFPVQKDFFLAHVSDDSISDPNVKVRYLPSAPDKAIIVGGSTDQTGMFPVGIGIFVFGIALGGFGFFKKE